ncbi:MAG: hypothetical protein GY853_01485 [PVC group bacterium]|nr:hypothetical protein [PVC group bacterium]
MIRSLIMWLLQRFRSIPCKKDYGLNVHLLYDLQQFEKLGELNPPLVRCDFNWFLIEPDEGKFDWEATDNIVSFCEGRGIKILAILGYNPEWADKGFNDPEFFIEKWVNFVETVVERYKGMINFYEIWNEPNLPRFYQGSRFFYFENILKPASEVISRKSDARIVAPCVSVMDNNDWYAWIKAAERYKKYFDIVSFHVYRDSALSVIRRIVFGIPFRGGSYKSILGTLQKLHKPIWLTETGWKTSNCFYEEQKEYIELLLNYIQHSPIEEVILYDIADSVDSSYGILEYDLKEKPAFKFLEELG